MIDEIMEKAGVPYCFGAWSPRKPPPLPYAVVLDQVESWGGDALNLAETHRVAVEVYTAKPDDAAVAFGSVLDGLGIGNDKGDPTWIKSEQFYMTPYYFEVVVKKGK